MTTDTTLKKKVKIQRKRNKSDAQMEANSLKRKATISEDTVWIYRKCGPAITLYRH